MFKAKKTIKFDRHSCLFHRLSFGTRGKRFTNIHSPCRQVMTSCLFSANEVGGFVRIVSNNDERDESSLAGSPAAFFVCGDHVVLSDVVVGDWPAFAISHLTNLSTTHQVSAVF